MPIGHTRGSLTLPSSSLGIFVVRAIAARVGGSHLHQVLDALILVRNVVILALVVDFN